jgi:hypothetical protein
MIAGRQAGVHQARIRDACEIPFLCLKFLPWPRKILSLGEQVGSESAIATVRMRLLEIQLSISGDLPMVG